MALVTMKEILYKAHENKYGVGAYSVLTTDALLGILHAAEEKQSPLILQMAQLRDLHTPLELLGPALVAIAQKMAVPVAVHLDHGLTFEYIKKAIDIGFTSVMIDASGYPLAENIQRTREVVDYARKYDITVEAEIGTVGAEGGDENETQLFTNHEEAFTLCEKADPDVLAVSIGNVHGNYTGEPNLQFDLLDTIHRSVKRPLVLHGGSGIDERGFRRCISLGISKINIATANYATAVKAVQDMPRFSVYQENSFIEMQKTIVQCVHTMTMKHMDMFMSSGKAY